MRAKQKFKKGTFSRRVFSVLMALAMVITLMPMNAMEVKAEDVITAQSFTLTHNSDGTYTVTDVTVPDGYKLYAGAVKASVVERIGAPSVFYEAMLFEFNALINAGKPVFSQGLNQNFEVVGISPNTPFNFTGDAVPDAGIFISVTKEYDEYKNIYPALTLGMTSNPAVGESSQNQLGAATNEYTITISPDIQNGTIRTDVQKQVAGQNVTVTALPASGYYLYSLKANDVDLMSKVSDDGGEKVCTFEMPNENVTITAEFKPKTSIETVELTVDKSKLPELTAGAALPEIESSPASVSGNQCSVEWCFWVVKVEDSWEVVEDLDNYTLQSGDEIALCIYLVADEKYAFKDTITGKLNGTETVAVEPDTISHGWAASVYMEVENPTSTPDHGSGSGSDSGSGSGSGSTPPAEVHTHTIVTDAAVAPTCTTEGKTEGSHCSACGKVITAQTTIPAKGHDWSGQWVITKLATTIAEGKKELACKNGCGHKKYEAIPVIGTQTDPDEGKLEKDAEVSPEAPIDEVTLNNKKSELLNASNIFTEEEKAAIEAGEEARVWMEVSKTDESKISNADKEEMTEAAKTVMGNNPVITYFDADLFKQVGNGKATQLSEPGINIDVTIKIPSDLLNNDGTIEREYKIIRLHIDEKTGNSIVDILSGNFDKATGQFTFQTDKFSTYAIVYTDKPVSENPTQDNNTNTNAIPTNPVNVTQTDSTKSNAKAPKTGDTNNTLLWTLILMLSAGVTAGAFTRRRKDNV